MTNLEQKSESPYRLCIHLRDFVPGESINDNITNSILNSYKTVVFLSKGYLKSEWCQYEFQQAHYEVIHGRPDCLVLILMEELDANELPPDIKSFMTTHTYIKWGDSLFWKRLSFGLRKPIPLDKV